MKGKDNKKYVRSIECTDAGSIRTTFSYSVRKCFNSYLPAVLVYLKKKKNFELYHSLVATMAGAYYAVKNIAPAIGEGAMAHTLYLRYDFELNCMQYLVPVSINYSLC